MSELLPPFHEVMHSIAECDKANDRVAVLEAAANTSICIFCGAQVAKDLPAMLEHAEGCKNRPENRLMERIAELEADLDVLDAKYVTVQHELAALKGRRCSGCTHSEDDCPVADAAWTTFGVVPFNCCCWEERKP